MAMNRDASAPDPRPSGGVTPPVGDVRSAAAAAAAAVNGEQETQRLAAAAFGHDSADADRPPRLLAKGYGELAERIIERAQEAGLYVHRSPELISLLMRVDLGAHIPPALYRAVAELLAWVHQMELDAIAARQGRDTPAPPASASGRTTES
jgi:flagellar biosynthesis protein